MKYDYYNAMKDDIKEYLKENYEREDYENTRKDDLYEKLYDDLWVEDSVTGNGSGSYTFNAFESGEYIAHNMDLLREALQEFGYLPTQWVSKGEEWCDVTIRCYLLPQVLSEVLDEIYEDID